MELQQQTPGTETQRRVVYARHLGDHTSFEVEFWLGDWRFTREVRISDPGADLDRVVAVIAREETGVTAPDEPTGQLLLSDESGRRYVVGSWDTVEVADEMEEGVDSLTFRFAQGETCQAGDVHDLIVRADRAAVPPAGQLVAAFDRALRRRVSGATWEAAIGASDLVVPAPADDWADRGDRHRARYLLRWLMGRGDDVPPVQAELFAAAIGTAEWHGSYSSAAALVDKIVNDAAA